MTRRFSLSVLARLLPLLTGVLAAAGTAWGFDWEVSTIEKGKWFDTMGSRSLVLDGSGKPQIAYGGRSLYNAWFDGAVWQTMVVDAGPGVGRYASIALPAGSSSTCIGYLDEAHGRVKYAQWVSRGIFPAVWYWRIETVDAATNGSVTLALNASGLPRLLYRSPTGDIRHAYKSGSSWSFETVYANTAADTHTFADMMLDSVGRTHVVFSRRDHALTHARRELNGIWTLTNFGVSGAGEAYPALALDVSDRPHVVAARNVTSGPNSWLVYYHHDGTNWVSESLWSSEAPTVAKCISAAMRAGKLHISYYDPDYKSLEYSNVTDGKSATIASGTNVGLYASIVLNGSGEPCVSYCDGPAQQLKYAARSGPTWSGTVVDRASAGPGSCSLAADGSGVLHATWVDSLQGELKWARQNGDAWDVSVVDDARNEGTSLKLATNGHPCVSYAGMESNTLRYASYFKFGATHFWLTEDIDMAGGGSSSLALDPGGWPRISYVAGRNLKYATKDTNGWHLVTVDDSGTVDFWGTSLAFAPGGTMAIAYGRAGVLRYAYSQWSHGTLVWWPSQVVATNYDVAIQPSLAFDGGGRPCIGFVDDSRGARLARRDGLGWHVQNVDTSQWAVASSYAMDPEGRHYLAYVTGDQTLRHAFGYGDPANPTWRLQTVAASGASFNRGLALLVRDSIPHLVFAGRDYDRDVQYARGLPLRLTSIGRAAHSTVRLRWSGETNGVEAQYCTNLGSSNWTAAAHNLGGTNCLLTATNPATFYRLKLE